MKNVTRSAFQVHWKRKFSSFPPQLTCSLLEWFVMSYELVLSVRLWTKNILSHSVRPSLKSNLVFESVEFCPNASMASKELWRMCPLLKENCFVLSCMLSFSKGSVVELETFKCFALCEEEEQIFTRVLPGPCYFIFWKGFTWKLKPAIFCIDTTGGVLSIRQRTQTCASTSSEFF